MRSPIELGYYHPACSPAPALICLQALWPPKGLMVPRLAGILLPPLYFIDTEGAAKGRFRLAPFEISQGSLQHHAAGPVGFFSI